MIIKSKQLVRIILTRGLKNWAIRHSNSNAQKKTIVHCFSIIRLSCNFCNEGLFFLTVFARKRFLFFRKTYKGSKRRDNVKNVSTVLGYFLSCENFD